MSLTFVGANHLCNEGNYSCMVSQCTSCLQMNQKTVIIDTSSLFYYLFCFCLFTNPLDDWLRSWHILSLSEQVTLQIATLLGAMPLSKQVTLQIPTVLVAPVLNSGVCYSLLVQWRYLVIMNFLQCWSQEIMTSRMRHKTMLEISLVHSNKVSLSANQYK